MAKPDETKAAARGPRRKEARMSSYPPKKDRTRAENLLGGSKPEERISPDPFSHLETRTYMLSAKVEDGFMQFYFKQRPSKPDWNGDGALDIRIPDNCHVRLLLDPELRWSFRHSFDPKDEPSSVTEFYNDAVTLADVGLHKVYCHLRHISDRELIFFAWKQCPRLIIVPIPYPPFFTIDFKLRDQFNIYVELDQLAASMVPGAKVLDSKRLVVKIDPDIQNPGDNTQGGGKNFELYLKNLIAQLQQALDVLEDKYD